MTVTHAATRNLEPKRRLVRLREVPQYYPISVSTLQRRIAEGKLIAYRHKRSIFVDLDDVDGLFRAVPSANPTTGTRLRPAALMRTDSHSVHPTRVGWVSRR